MSSRGGIQENAVAEIFAAVNRSREKQRQPLSSHSIDETFVSSNYLIVIGLAYPYILTIEVIVALMSIYP